MSQYCAVITGVHGTSGQAATIHKQWCGCIVEDMAEAMITGKRAVVAYLDGDNQTSIRIEVGMVAGKVGVPMEWHKCTTQQPDKKHYYVNSGGGITTVNNGARMHGCSNCGAVNPLSRMSCTGCGEPLYQAMESRMAEYNRRLREGLKNNDKRLAAISRQRILVTIAEIVGTDSGWTIDDNGFAHKPVTVKMEKPEYREEE